MDDDRTAPSNAQDTLDAVGTATEGIPESCPPHPCDGYHGFEPHVLVSILHDI